MAFEQIGLEAVLEGVSDFISDGEGINDAVSGMGAAFDAGASLISGAGDLIGSAIGGLASAALDLAAGAGGALVSFFQDSFSGALEAEQTMARLGQVITSTGGAAGITVQDAEALADQFKNLAGGSDDAIISIIDMGLRMGTISSDEMPSFIQSTLDLGAVMGDAGKAAQLMARAQEDPVGVLGALRKAGILVNETTEAQIKAMVKSGDTAGAYSILMDRVGEATQGAADTMAATTAGQWAIFQETLADAGETIVGAFLPALMGIAGPILDTVVPAISMFAETLGFVINDILGGDVGLAFDDLREGIFAVGTQLGFSKEQMQAFNGGLTAIWDWVQANLPLIQATFTTVWTTIQGVLQVVSDFITVTLLPAIANIIGQTNVQLPTMQQTFEAVMAGIVSATQMVATFITTVLVPVLTAAVDWVVANWPQIQATIEAAWAAVQTVFAAISAYITTTLIPAFQTAVAWIQENWPLIQAKIEEVMTAIQTAIDTVLNDVVPFVVEQFGIIKAWVDTNWPLIQATIDTIIGNISTNIHNVVDPLVAFWTTNHDTILLVASTIWDTIKLNIDTAINLILGIITTVMQLISGDWEGAWETIKETASTIWTNINTQIDLDIKAIQTIIETVVGAIKTWWETTWGEIKTKVETIIGEILTTITTKIGEIKTAITTKIGELQTWWDTTWAAIQTKVGTIIGEILTTITTKVDEIKTAFTSMDWIAIGTSIIEGIKSGIGSAVEGLLGAARQAATDAYNAIITALRGGSPMQLLVDAGKNIMGSMSSGVQAGVAETVVTARNAAMSIGQAFIGASSTMGFQAGQSFGNSYRQTVTSITASVGQAANSTLTTLTNNYQSAIDMLAASLGGSTTSAPPPMPGGGLIAPPPSTSPVPGMGLGRQAGNTYQYSPTYRNTPVSPTRDFSIMQVLAG